MGFFEVFAAALAGFYALVGNYGLAIILLTVAVRVLLLPLSIKQTRSMREMQKIQPEVKKIQAKHKGDRQKMNEEMMALYKEHGVNPFGGCLPLLMQMPVFIALYRLISTPLEYMGYELSGSRTYVPSEGVDGIMEQVQGSSLARALDTTPVQVNEFLGIFRLDCKPMDVFSGGGGCEGGVLPFIPYLVLIALMGFTTFYQQKQMQAQKGPSQDPQAQQMQMMMKIMPVMLMFFSFQFAAGLTLYWLTTNVWSIAQQHLMLRVAPAVATPGTGDAQGKELAKGSTKPSSGKPPKGAPSKPDTGDPKKAEAGPSKPSKNKSKKKRK